MNKLRVLLKVQIMGALGINKALHSGDKKDKTKLIRFALLMVFVFISMIFSIVMYDYLFIDAFNKAGVPELMPAMMMAAASVVTLFTTVYKVNGLIVGFKDYDMTMSMPIKTSVVVASRLLMMYLMNLGFCLFITLPAGIVYSFFVPVSVSFYLLMTVLALFVPLVPMLVGTFIGLLVTAASSHFRHSNIVNIVLMLILILGIMGSSFATPAVINIPESVSIMLKNTIYGIYPLTRMYTEALCGGNIISFMLFTVISTALFAAFAIVLGRFFKFLNTSFTTSRTRSNYRMTSLRSSSALGALYRRELRRYFSSALYVLNTGLGMVMALFMCGALVFFKPVQLEAILEIPGFAGAIGTLAPMVLSVMICMSCTASCSISLEGKSLWILKMIPIKSDTIFAAKMLVNLTITIPVSFLCSLILAFALPMNPVQIVFLILTPAAFAVLSAEFGLFLNLLYPNFDWTSEAVVIKQSPPSLISTLGGMTVTIAVLVGLTFLTQNLQMVGLAVVTLVVVAVDILFYRLLKTKGARMFRAL